MDVRYLRRDWHGRLGRVALALESRARRRREMTADVLGVLGVLLMISALVLLVFGQSALDCLVIAVVGLGLSRAGAA